jgi:F0F1-type ATP synthase membrane subunit c/vacuolar-type H+-ATPase subunit K
LVANLLPEMKEEENVHIVLTVHNGNSQPLNITGIGIQANQGPIYVYVAQRGSFNGSEGYVPAGGSAEIDLDGKAPKLVGTCRIIIGISGFLGGGENLSAGGFVASTYVDPAQSPTLLGFDPLLLITVFVTIIVIAALVVFLIKRKSWS